MQNLFVTFWKWRLTWDDVNICMFNKYPKMISTYVPATTGVLELSIYTNTRCTPLICCPDHFTKDGIRFVNALQTNTSSFDILLRAIGNTPCKILKFFICSIFLSTCIIAEAIIPVNYTSLEKCSLVLKGGQYNLTPFFSKSDFK